MREELNFMPGAKLLLVIGVPALVAAPAMAATSAAATSATAWQPHDSLALLTAATTIIALVVSYFVSKSTLKAPLRNAEASIW